MGRRIWVCIPGDGDLPSMTYDCRVTGFKRFLPAGPVSVSEPSSTDGIRRDHLVQLYTDPGGLRTLAVATVRLKDPRKQRA